MNGAWQKRYRAAKLRSFWRQRKCRGRALQRGLAGEFAASLTAWHGVCPHRRRLTLIEGDALK